MSRSIPGRKSIFRSGRREPAVHLTPGAFNDNRGVWGLFLARAYALKGDAEKVRFYAEEARKGFEDQLRARPQGALSHGGLGLALAYLGRKEESVREGERALALCPGPKDAWIGADLQVQFVKVHILGGEPEKAIDGLERLLKIPSYISPGWLRIDPNFDPLRTNPRFQKLAGVK